MNILVTGGLGTLGKVLVRELRRRGHSVFPLDLAHHHDAQYFRCDVASAQQVARVFESADFDLVYHLAAEFGRWNGEDFYDRLWTTNAIGTKNLIRQQERRKFRMVFFSSSEVYGDWDGVMSEDVMEKHEIKQLNDYAMTKWVGEMQCLNSAAMHGTETVRIRLFNCYGPGETYSSYRSAVCRFVYSALRDLPYQVFLGHHRTSTYVTDVCRTLANIAERFIPGEVYNIGGTEYHDMRSVSDMILRIAGKSDHLVEYVDGEPFTTRDKRIDLTKALRDLDHQPLIGLEEGLTRTIAWMRHIYVNGGADGDLDRFL